MDAKDWLMRAEEASHENRYRDTQALGEAMLYARSAMRKGRGTTSETRLRLEYEIARLSYDVGFVLAENKALREVVDIVLNMSDRLVNVEKIISAQPGNRTHIWGNQQSD